jgi:hypothetical protein
MYHLEGQPAPYLLPAYSCVVFGRRFVGESVKPAGLLVTRTRSTTVEGRGHTESSNHYKRAYYNTKSIFLRCKWSTLFRGRRGQNRPLPRYASLVKDPFGDPFVLRDHIAVSIYFKVDPGFL